MVVFKNKKISKIIEKPKNNLGKSIVTGLYVYDNDVIKLTKKLKPSKRNELEITDLNNLYLKNNNLNFNFLEEGSVWMDTGEINNLFNASQYVKIIQERNQILIGSPEIQAYKNGWTSKVKLKKILNTKKDLYSKKVLNFL